MQVGVLLLRIKDERCMGPERVRERLSCNLGPYLRHEDPHTTGSILPGHSRAPTSETRAATAPSRAAQPSPVWILPYPWCLLSSTLALPLPSIAGRAFFHLGKRLGTKSGSFSGNAIVVSFSALLPLAFTRGRLRAKTFQYA